MNSKIAIAIFIIASIILAQLIIYGLVAFVLFDLYWWVELAYLNPSDRVSIAFFWIVSSVIITYGKLILLAIIVD